jgi:hypothetical protein
MIRTSLVVAALLGWSSVAAAQSDAEPPAPAPAEGAPAEPPPPLATAAMMNPLPQPTVEPSKPGKKISVTWAPILLVAPVVELTAEYRVANKLGVSITVGAGKRTIEDEMFGDATGTEIEGGAQVRYYLIGDFDHGMELGVQALEEYVKFDEPLPPNVIAVAAGGFTVGGFLGYKIATRVGFTFEAQLGARYLVVEPAVQGSSAASFGDIKKWQPLLHLNIGWSF